MPQTPRYSNVQTAEPQQFRFSTTDPNYKLARKVDIGNNRNTGRTGSYGTGSPFSDPRRLNGSTATNNRFKGKDPGFGRGSWNWTGDGVEEGARRSTNKALDVTSSEVPGSKQRTLGDRGRVAISNAVDKVGKGVSSAKGQRGAGKGSTVSNGANSNGVSSAMGKGAGAVGQGLKVVSRTVSSSASGGVSVGAYKGGIGLGISRGGLDLGVGFASISYNFSNPNESSIGGAFNTLTITGTQEGCTIFLDYKFMGKKYFTETRTADKCEKPDPSSPNDDDIKEPGSNSDPNSPEPPTPDPNDTTGSPTRWTTSTTYGKPGTISDVWVGFTGSEYTPNYAYPPQFPDVGKSELHPLEGLNYRVNGEWELVAENYSFYTTFKFESRTPEGEIFDASIQVYTKRTQYSIRKNGQWLYSIPYTDQSLELRNTHFHHLVKFPFVRTNRDWTVSGDPEPSFKAKIPPMERVNPSSIGYSRMRLIIIDATPKPQPIPYRAIPTPRGVKEPVDSRQQILLERVYQMLGGDAFWENGLAVPNELFTPEPDGNSTQAKTYNEINNILFRTIDHRTPAQVKFPLANGAEYTSINAEGYFADLGKNVSELLEKANNPTKGDNSEVMGYMHRVSLLNTQIFNLLIKINELVKGIVGFLGIPMRETIEVVDIPFDPGLKGKLNKGFAKPEDLDAELDKLLKDQTASEEKIKETVARYASSGKIPVRVKKLRQSKEGGDFWWLIRNALNLKK